MDAFGRKRGDPDYDASSETDQMGASDGQVSNDSPGSPDVSHTQVQPTSTAPLPLPPATSPIGLPARSGWAANPVAGATYNSNTETPDQLVTRYKNDYHNDDASSVDAQLADWLKNQGASAPSSNTDFSTPDGQLAAVQQWIAASPDKWAGTDPSYLVRRINETGGFTPGNIAFWQSGIQGGQAAWSARESGGGAQASAPAPSQAGPYDAQISAQIEKLLADGNSPTDANSPVVKNATDAFRNSESFATDRAREKLAEQAAYSGMGSGSFDTAIQSELEQGGRDVASFQSTQITGELQRKADEIKTALSTATGSNAQALQLQLAQIQDQLSRAQLGQQNSQFYDRLSFDIGSQTNDLDSELRKFLQSPA